MTTTEQRPAAVPERRGRGSGRRRAGESRVLGLAAGLLLVAGAMGLQTMHLNASELSLPLTYTGDKGEDVDARRFTVRVDSVVAAKSIENYSTTIGTDHLFLVVNASATSSRKPYKLAQAVLLTADGKKFDATDRVDNAVTLPNTWVQPDIWVSGRFVFEVPASALPGASVVIGLPPSLVVEPNQPEAEIDLGLDEEGARKLAASAQDVYSVKK
ncbi:hypothetical protein ACIBP6_39015 [Nonomuraea terrae]|uniref:hypothetical protein n=1 Tax=Nonomuraea terrae TaxID=2530383 RepID=UPI0037A55D13